MYVSSVLASSTTMLAAANISGLSTAQAIGVFAGIPLGIIVLVGLSVFAGTRGKADSRSARVSARPRVRTDPVLGRPAGSENDPGPQPTSRRVTVEAASGTDAPKPKS